MEELQNINKTIKTNNTSGSIVWWAHCSLKSIIAGSVCVFMVFRPSIKFYQEEYKEKTGQWRIASTAYLIFVDKRSIKDL